MINLELGYLSSSFYRDEAPRTNAKVLESLRKSGKLVAGLTLSVAIKLTHSMNGYELHSWEEGGRRRFTLITGTNCVKSMEEITSAEDCISETGWVNIHMVGVDAVKTVLSTLPDGESVYWRDNCVQANYGPDRYMVATREDRGCDN